VPVLAGDANTEGLRYVKVKRVTLGEE